MKSALIQMQQVSAYIGQKEVLSEIDWEVHPGQHWIVKGPIGAGKTALVKAIMGEIRISHGKLSFPFLGPNATFEMRRQHIAFVPFGRKSKLATANNRTYYQQRYFGSQTEHQPTVREFLLQRTHGETFDFALLENLHLVQLLDQKHLVLSSGQTRRLLLAAALMQKPQLLLMDNTHLGLDPATRETFNSTLDALALDTDTSLILFGHFHSHPTCMTHELTLQNGHVHSNRQIAACKGSTEKLPHGVSRPIALPGNPLVRSETEVVRFHDVDLAYGSNTILKGVNWTVRRGEKWAVIGENGSGKSSLMAMIYADHPQVYSNDVYVHGKKRGTGESIWEVKQGMSFTSPEIQSYFDARMTVMQFLSTAFTSSMATRGLREDEEQKARSLLRSLNLDVPFDQIMPHLSDGAQRMLFFIRCILKKTHLYIMDEPFQGMDEQSVSRCHDVLRRLLGPSDTLLFITHYVAEVPDCVTHRYYLPTRQISLAK
ncbi:MAG: ATP-binding cassette domain-containing protein [Saprospiraceae bacterium]|nr:ATP-binding cassette domain-containing protein [Saprospiraceae bacterium]